MEYWSGGVLGGSERSLTLFEMTATNVLSFRPSGRILFAIGFETQHSISPILHQSILLAPDLI